jgi:hypothetical protein
MVSVKNEMGVVTANASAFFTIFFIARSPARR